MFTSIKLFVVMTLVTCFIAYWSDNLGKKLGKKRITFAGFRPRQTATAITMASSWSIMLVTLLVLMLLDTNTRWALTSFDSIKDQNQQFKDQNQQLNTQNQQLQAQTPRLKAQVQKLAQQGQTLERNNQTLQQHENLSNANIVRLDKQVSDGRVQLRQVQHGEDEARQSAAAARQSEAHAHQNEAVVQTHLIETKQQLNQKRQQLRQAKYQVVQVEKQRDNIKLTYHRGGIVLAHHMEELALQEANLEQELKQKQATVSTLEEQRKTLEAKVGDLQTRVNELSAKAADWQTKWYRTASERDELASLAPLANGSILVTVNQVFAAQTVPASSSSSEALAALRQLLADGNDMVKKPPISGQELRLVPLNIEAQGQRIQLKEDEIINRLADYISTFEVPASVRLVAAYNQVAGETEIGGRMVVVPVRPAVVRGGMLSLMTIDGSQSDAHIFNQLLALVNEGEKAARSRGVVPPQAPSSPDFYAAGTNERIFEALRRIQTIKGPARVRLLAATDLSAADAARVRFEVSHFEVSRP